MKLAHKGKKADCHAVTSSLMRQAAKVVQISTLGGNVGVAVE